MDVCTIHVYVVLQVLVVYVNVSMYGHNKDKTINNALLLMQKLACTWKHSIAGLTRLAAIPLFWKVFQQSPLFDTEFIQEPSLEAKYEFSVNLTDSVCIFRIEN